MPVTPALRTSPVARSRAAATSAAAGGSGPPLGAGRRRHLVGVARAQLDAEGSRRPEILAVVQPARRLLARPHAAIPGAARPPARAGDAVGALELEAVRGRLDRRVAVREALAVDAPPRAERRELEPDRPVGGHETVDDPDRAAAVCHRDLALEDDVPDLPAPPRHAPVERERDEELVAARIDRAGPPFVGRKPVASVADDEDGLERREPEHPGRRPAGGLDEQPVVAARPQARDGSHRIPAEPVGDEPLAQGGLVEAPAGLRAEDDHGATGPVSRSSTSPIVGTSAPPWRRMRSATMPVQPVWWLAPSPAPLSPWKYS